MGHLLAIDAGTGGCRAVVFTDEGCPLAEAGRRWSQPADPRYPGSAGFDTGAAWALIAESVRESLGAAGVAGRDVRAVSAASVRGGLVLLDGAGRELWACGSTDARAADQVELIRRREPGFEAEMYARTGQTLSMGALPRLLWLAEQLPAVYEATASVRTIAFGAGAVVRWFLDAFCAEPDAAAAPAGAAGPGYTGQAAAGPGAFEAMAQQARAVPAGAEGVVAVFSNAMEYGRWRHAAPSLLNLPVGEPRTARATLFRALLENAALVTRANLETIEESYDLKAEQVAFGGGAARSQLWAQILADVLGRPVRVPAGGRPRWARRSWPASAREPSTTPPRLPPPWPAAGGSTSPTPAPPPPTGTAWSAGAPPTPPSSTWRSGV